MHKVTAPAPPGTVAQKHRHRLLSQLRQCFYGFFHDGKVFVAPKLRSVISCQVGIMLPEIEIDCIIARRGQRTGIDFQRQLPMRGEAFVCRSDANVGVDRYAVTAAFASAGTSISAQTAGGTFPSKSPLGASSRISAKGTPWASGRYFSTYKRTSKGAVTRTR